MEATSFITHRLHLFKADALFFRTEASRKTSGPFNCPPPSAYFFFCNSGAVGACNGGRGAVACVSRRGLSFPSSGEVPRPPRTHLFGKRKSQ